MGIFFGTDGIRGIVNNELTYDLAYKCGNSLATSKPNAKIIIGRDTRTTGSYLTLAVAVGAISAGAEIIDVGICPTAGVAYLTKLLQADFGVIISASHNPAEYNGIKIFNKNGYKLSEKEENDLEKKFINQTTIIQKNIKNYTQNHKLIQNYVNFLINSTKPDLSNMKIVIDASNGAAYKIAPNVFKKLGAKIVKINCNKCGKKINDNCGSLYPETLCKTVIETNSNMGFAFDGDADRIIACDEKGNIIDGDLIIFILAKYLKSKKLLKNNTVVGTSLTNIGIEKSLKKFNINLIRTDVGDKYVLEKIIQNKLSLGGEKSGHVILKDYSTTGDGLLTALKIAEVIKETNLPLSALAKTKLLPQSNIDCIVKDKIKTINSPQLSNAILKQKEQLTKDSRIIVRASGTEPKIRIMVETTSLKIANKIALELSQKIKQIDLLEEN